MNRNDKLFSYVGFSIKSGKILFGYETVIESGKKVFLVLCDASIGRSAKNEIAFYAKNKNVPIAYLPESALSEYCGGRKVKCVGLTDEGLALASKRELYKLSEVVIDE